jgi:hypothetical protein
MKEVTYQWAAGPIAIRDADRSRASAGGRVFSLNGRNPRTQPEMRTLVLRGDKAERHINSDHRNVHGIPTPAGDLVCAPTGLFTPELRLSRKRADGDPEYLFPACQGNVCVQLFLRDRSPGTGSLAFRLPFDDRALARLEDVEGIWFNRGASGSSPDLTFDKRIIYIPEAQLLITVPMTDDRLVLRRFDLDETLEKSGLDYLFVTSVPPGIAGRGEEYRYTLSVKAKKPGVKVRLDAGPPGMKVSEAGELTWAVPADFKSAEAEVSLTVSDSTGQEVPHAFKVAVRDK